MSNLHLKYGKSKIKWGYNFLRYSKSKFHIDLSLKKKKKKSIDWSNHNLVPNHEEFKFVYTNQFIKYEEKKKKKTFSLCSKRFFLFFPTSFKFID